jgi:HAD superfamily hydrolase (TIGR01509 family)
LKTAAVLFDNDGVLVDTETLFFATTRSAFERLDLDLTADTWGRRYLAEGNSSREIALAMGAHPGAVDEVLEERNRQFRSVLQQPPRLRPLVRETLAQLRGAVRIAIVTGCGREQLALAHATSGLLDLFELIITSDDCARSKPDPEPYLNAVRILGLRAEHCLAVEDSPRGLASASAAGVPCIVVPTELTRNLPFPGASAIESDLAGVLKHIRCAPARP